jgi:CRISPR-associated protein Cas5h
MQRLISVDFKGHFGFFRKPDANNTINLSYNMLHKPALLGILGAIVGLDGYKKKNELPAYYKQLKSLQVGVEPLNHDQGNFQKTVIKYSNTVGYANKGTTYLTEEATLINPAYRVYMLLDDTIDVQAKLYDYLTTGKTEFVPYFGKNEHNTWWLREDVLEYEFDSVEEIKDSYKVRTLFEKSNVLQGNTEAIFDLFSFHETASPFIFFERLPKGFDEELFQYELGEFVYTTYDIKPTYQVKNLYALNNESNYIQLY